MTNCTSATRIADLAQLPAGWLDGAGNRISQRAVLTALAVLPGLPMAGLGIFPTEEGGIAFEFKRGGWDYTVECGPDGAATIYGVEIEGVGEIEPRPYLGQADPVTPYRRYLPSLSWLLVVMGSTFLMAAWLAS